jgi:hypothetical protein
MLLAASRTDCAPFMRDFSPPPTDGPKGVDELLLRGFKILGQLADQRCSAPIQVLPQSH